MIIKGKFNPEKLQSYSYNCDFDVKVGDKVIVPVGNKTTKVEVIEINCETPNFPLKDVIDIAKDDGG